MSRKTASLNILYVMFIAPFVVLLIMKQLAIFIESDDILINIYYVIDICFITILIYFNRQYFKKQYKLFFHQVSFMKYFIQVVLGVLLMAVAIILVSIFLVEKAESDNEATLNGLINGYTFVFSFINLVIFTPIKEELAYRASLFHLIAGENIGKSKKWVKVVAAIIVVLFFTYLHVDSELFAGDFMHLIAVSYVYFFLSLLITFFYIKYGYNVFAAIGVHMFNNYNAMIPVLGVIIVIVLFFLQLI